ncbi:MAG TPA: hydrogenobyrinic acid a,c-diamide synthase (glutamine-hydrolyzing) [Syntrophomonadaceae bacterium]|nr:hydrogenobyrinic acid a,c-diamide synthase (glutamine-hydrolyzing) [Syntrophomonadaceae bacterium]HPR94179.1 hydrogenobyrinic acid a,c-diamide synthase (glutamine-hydrolyzing) [Syntrophomonadaceae bacterium]
MSDLRLTMGAAHGRSGKTSVTLGLIAALRRKGFTVQPFKKGPDFIDPGWLSLAAGRNCRCLDLFFLDKESLVRQFVSGCQGADIAVIEGAMGLFDGLDLQGSDSTAAVAKAVKSPIILVVDATRMTRSAAALVKGFQSFEPETEIAAVILNKVARPRHEDMLRKSIESYTGIPVVGAIPKQKVPLIAERHLGLVTAGEWVKVHELIETLGEKTEQSTDLAAIIRIAAAAPPLPSYELQRQKTTGKVRIGVIKDQVFSFYYPENLEALENAGAELVFVNSLADSSLPDIQGLYIGGGFPEVFGRELEKNADLRTSIREKVNNGLPVYAECGGLMYLARRIYYENQMFEMVGALPCDVKMSAQPKGHGYSLMKIVKPNYLFRQNTVIRGHEFHHSQICNTDPHMLGTIMEVQRGYGIDGKNDGIIYHNVIAAYQHIYAPAIPEWAVNFVAQSIKYNENLLKLPG